MFRSWKAPLAIAAIAVGSLFIAAPTASAMPYRGGFRGGFYVGGGWYGPGWGYGPAWWGPGYYYGPGPGKVKFVTHDKNASVYVDGGYVGLIAQFKKFPLPPGSHDIEVRDPAGRTIYHQRVDVIRGHTTDIPVA